MKLINYTGVARNNQNDIKCSDVSVVLALTKKSRYYILSVLKIKRV